MNCGFLKTILTLFMPEYLRFRSTYYGHFQNGRYLVNFCLKRTIKMIGLRWGAYMLELFFTKSYACILRFFLSGVHAIYSFVLFYFSISDRNIMEFSTLKINVKCVKICGQINQCSLEGILNFIKKTNLLPRVISHRCRSAAPGLSFFQMDSGTSIFFRLGVQICSLESS